MATLYITSTANTGTGTLRTLCSSAAAGDVIQPSPTLFPKGTPCNVSITSSFGILQNQTIQGGQTRLVITSTSTLSHGNSSNKPSYVNYTDVDFRGFTAASGGAIHSQYCYAHTFLRCSFCGISGYTAPIVLYSTTAPTTTFRDCAFYGNRATQNSSGAQGAIYHNADSVAAKTSLINCTFGANYRNYSSSPRSNWNRTIKEQTNIVNTAAQEADWKTPPASSYGYSSWSKTAYQSMDPRPSATASWRTGATSTTSTIDLDGNPRKTNGALGAYEYYAGKLATPTNLTAYDITPGGFTLTWSNVTNANSYKVTCNGVTTTVYSNVKTFTGLSPLTTYPVSVVACDSNGAYLDSDAATTSVTTPEDSYLPPLDAPGLRASYINANELWVEWQLPPGGAYVVVKVYQGSSTGAVLDSHTYDATWNEHSYSPIVPNQTYVVGLQALPIEDSEKWSASEEAFYTFTYTAATQLAKPSIHGFPRASGSTIYTTLQIRLAATIENATTYEYQIALDSNFTNGVLTRTSSTVSSGYPVSGYFTGLTSGTTYYCRARAKGDGVQYVDSEWSAVLSTQVSSQLATPIVTISDLTQTSATLSWGAVANRSSYTVKWRASGASTWNQTTGLTATSKALTGLTLGTTYEYEVIAVGNGTTYITSEAATGTFATVALITLDTPTNLASSNITNNSATVSWSDVSHASGYKVEYRASGATTWTEATVEA